jgi:hypothetical protein
MSQHDLNIANQGFPAFRADLNDALVALGSTNSGATAPATTFANQLWYDTANNILKIRNEDNDAWISLLTLNQTADTVSEIATAIATLGAGSASNPALTTAGDANTGIFFPAADTIAFAEGGVEVMRIDASGNVGIGNNNPTSFPFGKLVVGAASGNNSITIASGTAGEGTLAFADGTTGTEGYRGFIQYQHSSDFFSFGTSGAEKMRINSSGDVGIGLTNGASKLTIFNSPGYGHFNSGNSAENGSYPLVGAFDNPAVASATYGWGFYDSNATGNFSLYRRNGSTTGIKTCEWNRSNGNFSFDSGYGSAAVAYGCRAWVKFNGTGTVAINGSGNVSSITDQGTGTYRVNFTNAMPDTNYSALCNRSLTTDINQIFRPEECTTSYVQCINSNPAIANYDSSQCFVAVFR